LSDRGARFIAEVKDAVVAITAREVTLIVRGKVEE